MKYIETQLLLVLFWQAGDPTFVATTRPRLKAMMGTPPKRKAFRNFRKTQGGEKISGREISARAPEATIQGAIMGETTGKITGRSGEVTGRKYGEILRA